MLPVVPLRFAVGLSLMGTNAIADVAKQIVSQIPIRDLQSCVAVWRHFGQESRLGDTEQAVSFDAVGEFRGESPRISQSSTFSSQS